MAEGFVRTLAGSGADAYSAGTHPKGLHPYAIDVMREAGVDISGQTSDRVDDYVDEEWDAVITVCDHANEACPVFSGVASRLHWSFPDPAEASGTRAEQLVMFRDVRDSIRRKIVGWLASERT